MKAIYFTLTTLLLLGITRANGQICVGNQGSLQWECWLNLYEDSFNELTARPDYPNHPAVVKTIYKTQAPENYGEYIGVRIRGFLSVPTNTTATFNVTGNRKTQFYLSTDANPANKQLMAWTDDFTEIEEHTKYATQTTTSVNMVAGAYYYFEMFYVESTGSDHMRLWWKTNLVSTTTWNIISSSFIYDVGCKPTACPPAGTPCDDGNFNTTGDQEDGYCHCIGAPVSITDSCVGEWMKVQKYRYDNIAGSGFTELYAAPNYPGMPNFMENMNYLGHESRGEEDNSASLMQCFIKVPVNGNYKFLITSDDNGAAFLSSDNNPENMQAHQFLVPGFTNLNQYDKYIFQKTSNLNLDAGRFYYLEVNHKAGGGSNHFGIFWQTPFTEPGVWKRIPKIYAYDYACEVACIAENTPCDDGNPFTNDDKIDANCNCTGTPCSGPDCDSPLANYQPYEKCSYTGQIAALPESNWLSCQASASPNPARSNVHWISYDLGQEYKLTTSQVWNYNVANEVSKGFQNVSVDYSSDGNTWTTLGNYNWPQATGDANYSGFAGPNFQGIKARYILFSTTAAPGACKGIAKAAFKVVSCPSQGTACDDGDPGTVADQYNNDCQCQGVNLLQNICDNLTLSLGDTLLLSNNYSAKNRLESESTISTMQTVSFYGGEEIELLPGFETQANTVFWAAIDVCPELAALRPSDDEGMAQKKRALEEKGMIITSLGQDDLFSISFHVKQVGKGRLYLMDKASGQKTQIFQGEFSNTGWFHKVLRLKKLKNWELMEAVFINDGALLSAPLSVINEEMSNQK